MSLLSLLIRSIVTDVFIVLMSKQDKSCFLFLVQNNLSGQHTVKEFTSIKKKFQEKAKMQKSDVCSCDRYNK